MEDAKAKELLAAERARVEGLLKDIGEAGTADRVAADEPGDMFDSAEPLTTEGTDDAIRAGLEERLAAVGRAEQRVDGGHVRGLRAQRAADTRRSPGSRSDRGADGRGGERRADLTVADLTVEEAGVEEAG